MRVGFIIVGVAFFVFAARSQATPFVQFLSNQSGYEEVTEQVPTAFGLTQGLTSTISRFQVNAPASQPNWTSQAGGGSVTTSVTDSSLSVSVANSPRVPVSGGNLLIHYDYVDAGTASVTFQLLQEARATLTETPINGQVSVGPLHFIEQPPLDNLSAILEPGTYTMTLPLVSSSGSVPSGSGTVTFTSVPEPTIIYVGMLAAWGVCRRRRGAVRQSARVN